MKTGKIYPFPSFPLTYRAFLKYEGESIRLRNELNTRRSYEQEIFSVDLFDRA